MAIGKRRWEVGMSLMSALRRSISGTGILTSPVGDSGSSQVIYASVGAGNLRVMV